MLKHGFFQAGRCKLFVQSRWVIRKTQLCTVGYSDKRPHTFSMDDVDGYDRCCTFSASFYNSVMAYVNRPNALTANAGYRVAVNTNIRVRWPSRRLEGHIGKKILGWEEGWARFHPQGFMTFADE